MAAISYKDLVEAGAPELPGKLFYRVKVDLEGFVRVEVRGPRLLGSQMLAARSGRVNKEGEPLPQIVELATDAANATRVGLGVHALLGDYRKDLS